MRESFVRKVKIVATLGPSSQDEKIIQKLISSGLDIARLNFSHGEHDYHQNLLSKVRYSANALNRNVAVMQDLQGPKIRIGKLPDSGVVLSNGEGITLFPEGNGKLLIEGEHKKIPIFKEIAEVIAQDVQVNSRILFDDGKIITKVVKVKAPEITVEVIEGGVLKSRKGMNLPGTPLSVETITEKDIKDLVWGLQNGVDAIALSFVRKPSEIEFVRKIIAKESNHRPMVIAKIEREEAVEEYEAIIDVSDGILVARGDMAVEIGVERVPLIQKRLIRASQEVGVPVITATQMLESMIYSPTPTRAEASDIANAVLDGTDAVMLSAETAAGNFPIQALETMKSIIINTENHIDELQLMPGLLPMPGSVIDSIEYSASKIADHVDANVIACISRSGYAAQTLAKYRPRKPIIAILNDEIVFRKMAFVWGVQGVLMPEIAPTDDLFLMVEKTLLDHGWAEDGENIVITAGVPSFLKGTTNTIKVHRVGASIERSGA